MDNAYKRQSKRVNEPAAAPLAPGRDVLLALATAWSSSHGGPAAAVRAVITPPAAAHAFGATGLFGVASAGRTPRR
jgi:hypothetical protein